MNLRPLLLNDLVGQEKAKERLRITIKSCKTTGEKFPHTLLFGPAGTGKTSIANIISNEMNYGIEFANGANLSSIKSLLPYLARVKNNGILFIDEIHRIPIKVAEFLYVAIEDYRIDIGKQNQMSINLPRFTFVGATTNSGLIPKPLYDRFVLKLHLELYSIDELVKIISSTADKMNMILDHGAKTIVAQSSRRTPRIANNRLEWLKHFSISKNISILTKDHIYDALNLEGVEVNGIDDNDKKYLSALKRHQPAGINTMVSSTNIAKDTIEQVIEPFLLSLNLIRKTPKGRILVSKV